MGICVKCGKETNNEYDYYSADFKKDNLGTAWTPAKPLSFSMRGTLYQYTYYNFQYEKDYACTRCVLGSWYIIWRYVLAIWLTLFLLPIVVATPFVIFTHQVSPDSGLVVGAVAIIGLAGSWLLVYRARKSIKGDKSRYNKSSGSILVARAHAGKNSRKHYFTPKEYESLRKAR